MTQDTTPVDLFAGGLDVLRLEDTATLTLRDPSGHILQGPTGKLVDGKPERADVVFTLLRLQSREAQQFSRELQSERVTEAARNGRGSVKINTEDSYIDGGKILAKCTKAWTNLVVGGKPFPCTEANALLIYNDAQLVWIRDQVDAFIANATEFLKNSSGS